LALQEDWSVAMLKRRRIRQTASLEDRLVEAARRLRAEAEQMPAGAGRDKTLRKARQAEIAAHLSCWLTSPGLPPPQ
jgi:hypothetical protein